ncbi:MAG: AtpZ/AtpI family protein [Anaerolineae bacterium]|nr:AtpZ/AtpI family protein [Anaerolineae bacterium]
MSENEPPDKISYRTFWKLVATLSSLGWSMVLPIVGGALLGHYLDKLSGGGVEWTVSLLFVGVALALYNLYHILFKETIK